MSQSQDHPAYRPGSQQLVRVSDRSRGITVLLALFLGGLGVHRFYLNRPGSGVLYLLFCWTLIPGLIALFEIIRVLVMSDRDFDRTYNYGYR